MSTRSAIGRLNADGTVLAVYCHSDGYIEKPGAGNTLHKHYRDDDKVRTLLECGALSWLGPNIGERGYHTPGIEFILRDENDSWLSSSINLEDIKKSQEKYDGEGVITKLVENEIGALQMSAKMHKFDTCFYYWRDRGLEEDWEHCQGTLFKNPEHLYRTAFHRFGAEYAYLYIPQDNIWGVCNTYFTRKGQKPKELELTQKLIDERKRAKDKEVAEEEARRKKQRQLMA